MMSRIIGNVGSCIIAAWTALMTKSFKLSLSNPLILCKSKTRITSVHLYITSWTSQDEKLKAWLVIISVLCSNQVKRNRNKRVTLTASSCLSTFTHWITCEKRCDSKYFSPLPLSAYLPLQAYVLWKRLSFVFHFEFISCPPPPPTSYLIEQILTQNFLVCRCSSGVSANYEIRWRATQLCVAGHTRIAYIWII